MVYLTLAAALSIGLFYPYLVYTDLAGMGGYDGFASREMMLEHSAAWSGTSGPSIAYYVFAGFALLWALSFLRIPVSLVLLMRQSAKQRQVNEEHARNDW